MKAVVYTRYGPPNVLQLREVETPTPGDDEVLVRVRATSINAADWHLMRGKPFLGRLIIGGLRRPNNPLLGRDVAGRVEAVGRDVTEFWPGDEVFGATSGGGFAEYVAVRARGLVLKPPAVSFEEAAAVPVAAVTALQALRDKGQVQPGQKVLINGASGGVGTFAVQLARAFGAEVTAVCSTRNLEMARRIGANNVVDYTKEDFTRQGRQYDLIIDVASSRSISDYTRALGPNGICVATGFSTVSHMLRSMLMAAWASRTGSRKFARFMARVNRGDLTVLKELLEARKIVPAIDRCYPLSETAEAMRQFGVEHAQGKIIITPVTSSE
jgi:NADPH:quinone reductase-like Zn-dependent oxidoreductase